MGNPKWFDRSFDLGFGADRYPAIYERLAGAPQRLQQAVAELREGILTDKPEGKWSIKEQAGHLFTMEPLWRMRFGDIVTMKPMLTVADLDNTATTEAGFNTVPIGELLQRFAAERQKTIHLLDQVDAKNVQRTSLHPRLKQPMRIIDLAYFVAEHDDHHLAIVRGMAK
jgi:uncharacterized damage-inducible protein DinB